MKSVGKAVSKLFGGGGNDNGAAQAVAAASDRAAQASAQAAEATARAEASRLAAEKSTQNMKANFATDLSQDNTATVVSGGTADSVSVADDLLKKKKSAGNALSTQLGINT